MYQWYTGYGLGRFWISAYQDIPQMFIDLETGKPVDFGYGVVTPVPGLTKVSATEFKYAAASGTWTISKGNFETTISGYSYYQVCFEK